MREGGGKVGERGRGEGGKERGRKEGGRGEGGEGGKEKRKENSATKYRKMDNVCKASSTQQPKIMLLVGYT